MLIKILKCFSSEETLRILNLIYSREFIKEEELYNILDFPKFEIHMHINELVNLEVALEKSENGESILLLNKQILKKYTFIERLIENLKTESVFLMDLKK